MSDDPWVNFLSWEQASRDTIDFKTIYVDMADDLISGLLLSQIVYWYLPSKKGGSKLRVFKDGYYWIAKARHDWWDEIRVKTRQIDRAIAILEKKGIIVSHLFRFNNAPTTHIRIVKEGFLFAWNYALTRFDETVKSEVPADPFSPNLQFDLTDSSNAIDETVKSDCTESVQSLTETTIDLTETTAENTSDFSPEKPDPLLFDLERQTLENNESNYATPAHAGGDNSAAEAGLIALYEAKGSEAPRRHSSGYADQVEKISQVLRDCAVTDPEIARLASQLLVEDKPKMANPYYRPFSAEYADYLGRAKKQLADQGRTAPRHQPESALWSQEALRERQAAQPPPPEDDATGQAIKTQLALLMDQPSYQTWVTPVRITTADGDLLMISAPTDLTKDWLENRLGDTIRRTAVGVLGKTVEVRFETIGMGEYEIPLATVEVNDG